jgi:hypothetical protein
MALALCTKMESTLIGQEVVRLSIQINVGGFPVQCVTQEPIWFYAYANIRGGKVAVRLSLHAEMVVGWMPLRWLRKSFKSSGPCGVHQKRFMKINFLRASII